MGDAGAGEARAVRTAGGRVQKGTRAGTPMTMGARRVSKRRDMRLHGTAGGGQGCHFVAGRVS